MDPGYNVLLDAFKAAAAKKGLTEVEQTFPSNHPGLGPYSVQSRFRRSKESRYPLWQIGPGIFAANETAATYEWKTFRKFSIDGLRAVLKGYPKLDTFPHRLRSIELRYRNVFTPPLIKTTDLYKFMEEYTTSRLEPGPAVADLSAGGRISAKLEQTAVLPDGAKFTATIGTATSAGEPAIMLETLYRQAMDVPTSRENALTRVSKELTRAHEMASPFFEQFLTPDFYAGLGR